MRQPVEILQHGFDQLLLAGVLRSRRCCKQAHEISRFLGGLAPVRGRCREELSFQFVLPLAQRPFIGLYFGNETAQLRGLLRRHAAVFVQIDGPLGHRCIRHRCEAARRFSGYLGAFWAAPF